MRNALFLISLALSSAACNDASADRDKAASAENSAVPQATRTVAPADDAKPFSMTDNDESDSGSREYTYNWPVEVSREAGLVKLFQANIASDLAGQKREWQESMVDCPKDMVSCRNNSMSVAWEVVANLPRFLSLSSHISSYSGGAHGNYGRTALVWDRKTGKSFDPKAMFDLAALEQATAIPRCRLLNAERAERRGEPVPENGSAWPDDCPDMESVTLFVGSSDGNTFDRLGFYYSPYVAGPYAEGDYEVDLPVTARILGAVKPQYRAVFAANR